MSFTEQDRLNQEKQVAELVDELNRLDAEFNAVLKAAGITQADLNPADLDDIPRELQGPMAEARRKAEQEGRERTARARVATGSPAAPKAAARRRGIRA